MVTDALQRNKINIASIRETHYPYGHNYINNGYRIITTAAIKNTDTIKHQDYTQEE